MGKTPELRIKVSFSNGQTMEAIYNCEGVSFQAEQKLASDGLFVLAKSIETHGVMRKPEPVSREAEMMADFHKAFPPAA